MRVLAALRLAVAAAAALAVAAAPSDLPTFAPTVLACPAHGDPPHPLCKVNFPDDFGADETGPSSAPGRAIVAAARRAGVNLAQASLLGCGGWGCGYKLTMAPSDGGLGNDTFIVKRFHTEFDLTVEFTYEVQRRLGDHCPSVQRPVAYCPNGNHVHRHNPAGIGLRHWLDNAIATVVADPDAAVAAALAGRVGRWVRHMLEELAPCVASRGLITEDLDPENSWVDDRDDPGSTISAFDIDFWAWVEWYGCTPTEAVRMNQERIADTFFRALSRIEAPRLAKPLQPVLAYLRPFLNPVQYGWEPFVHVYRFAVDPMLAVFRHRFRPNPEHMRLTADAAGREAYFTQYHEPANFEPGPGEDGHDPDADAWERCIGPRFWARTREERCCKVYPPGDANAPAYSCNTPAVHRVCAEIHNSGEKTKRKPRKKKKKKKKKKKTTTKEQRREQGPNAEL